MPTAVRGTRTVVIEVGSEPSGGVPRYRAVDDGRRVRAGRSRPRVQPVDDRLAVDPRGALNPSLAAWTETENRGCIKAGRKSYEQPQKH